MPKKPKKKPITKKTKASKTERDLNFGLAWCSHSQQLTPQRRSWCFFQHQEHTYSTMSQILQCPIYKTDLPVFTCSTMSEDLRF